MILAPGRNRDTVHIRNPNAADLRCDSVVLLFADLTLGGILLYSSHGEGVTPASHPFSGYPKPLPDPATGGYRAVYAYGSTGIYLRPVKIDFPAGRTVNFVWQAYDPCPTCKRSAAPAAADSLGFRMVLHVGRRADTLGMTMDRRMTVGIAPPLRKDPGRTRTRQSHAWDPLGRWWTKSGGREMVRRQPRGQ